MFNSKKKGGCVQ